MRVLVASPLRHNGKRYGEGATLDLSDADAERLTRLGCVVALAKGSAITEPAPPIDEPVEDEVDEADSGAELEPAASTERAPRRRGRR